jgi:hypothetical protein
LRYWTWNEIKTKIENDLDLQDEDFISTNELLGYANEAIDEAEAEIHTLYEDYFLTQLPIGMVNNQDKYDLPSNIYGMKIRKLMYQNGASVYPIPRLKDSRKIETYQENNVVGAGTLYSYFIDNSTAGSPKIVITPMPYETGAFLTIWFLRNANRLVNVLDICDIPEAISFILQYMKVRCYEKEGHPNLAKAMGDLEQQRGQLSNVLSSMTADGDNKIEPDLSAYAEMN